MAGSTHGRWGCSFTLVRLASFVLWLTPAARLAQGWWRGTLGLNPLNELLHVSGRWALIMLLVALGVPPLRRLLLKLSQATRARHGRRPSDWNWLIRLRRQLGLFAFFYAGLHLALYLALDAGWDGEAIRDDLLERPFIAVGLLAFALMLPLALTSTHAAMRLLGPRWGQLHLLVYTVTGLALLHFWWHQKVGHTAPWPYTVIFAGLLVARLLAWRRAEHRGPTIELPERPTGPRADHPPPP